MYHNKSVELALCCSADGTIAKVLQNPLALKGRLTAGLPLASIAVADSRWKMLSFFQKIVESGAALNCELDVALERGILPISFSGCRASFGIVIIGFSESRLPKELRGRLVEMSSENCDYARNGHLKSATAQYGGTHPEAPTAEDQLARLNHALLRAQQELAEKKLELQRYKAGTFQELGMAVHGLRNPASSILSATEYLIEETADSLAQEQITLLQGVMQSSLFILQMIDELLQISSIECGKLKVDLRPTDLVSLVGQAVLLNEGNAARKGVRLDTSFESPAFVVHVDPIKMAQVIDNLVSNAIKFSHLGGRVKIRISATESTASVSVRDDGPGISANHIKTIFNLFQSGRKGSGLHQTGTGFGLAISKRLVEGQAGTIEVQSQLGRGSTFIVKLPMPTGVQLPSANPARKKSGQSAVADRLARHAGMGA
jgi:signal transduction histidine kinase